MYWDNYKSIFIKRFTFKQKNSKAFNPKTYRYASSKLHSLSRNIICPGSDSSIYIITWILEYKLLSGFFVFKDKGGISKFYS